MDASISLSFWVKTPSSAANKILFRSDDDNSNITQIMIRNSGSGQPNQTRISTYNGSSWTHTYGPAEIPDDTWHLCQYTYDGTSVRNLYLDASTSSPWITQTRGSVGSTGTDIYFGTDHFLGLPLDGEMDQIRAKRSVWTSSERSDMWNSGAGL